MAVSSPLVFFMLWQAAMGLCPPPRKAAQGGLLGRSGASRLALAGALAAAAGGGLAPRALAICDPTTTEECTGNFWMTGKLTYNKAEQLSEYKSNAPLQSDRTILRLTSRLQRQRQAFGDLAPLIALGEAEEARRRLRSPPLDGVRKASSDLALLFTDTRKARDAQRSFTAAVDRLDSQLMRVGRKERGIDGLSGDFSTAEREFDEYLALVGVPKAERAPPAGAKNSAPASLR